MKCYYQHILHIICVKGDICRQSVHIPRITQRRDWSAPNPHSEHCGCVALVSTSMQKLPSATGTHDPLAGHSWVCRGATYSDLSCSLYFAFFLGPLPLERTAVKSLQGTDILERKQTAADT